MQNTRTRSFATITSELLNIASPYSGLVPTHPKHVLDVGTGTTAWPRVLRDAGYLVTAIDNVTDYWPEGMVNRHWRVIDLNIARANGDHFQRFDAITCISVVEHIYDHLAAVRAMFDLLNTGGILILTTPFSWNDPHPNVYERPDTFFKDPVTYICRQSCHRELNEWLSCGFVLRTTELWRIFSGPAWGTGERSEWVQAGNEQEPHQLGCFVFQKQ